jgi:hypothetical protein
MMAVGSATFHVYGDSPGARCEHLTAYSWGSNIKNNVSCTKLPAIPQNPAFHAGFPISPGNSILPVTGLSFYPTSALLQIM